MEKINNLLLCVGAQKAGTSWLAKMLSNHKDIEFSKYKEVHYFDSKQGLNNQLYNRLIKEMSGVLKITPQKLTTSVFESENEAITKIKSMVDMEWYIQQFRHNKKYQSDFTPEYALLDEQSFLDIAKTSSNQKVIYIMREPVSRTLSAIQYFYQNRNIDITSVKTEVLNKKVLSKLFLDRSLYHNTIHQIKKHFKKEDVLFLFYEDMMKNKQEHINKVCDFLSIEPIIIDNKVLDKKVNSSFSFSFDSTTLEILDTSLIPVVNEVEKQLGYVPMSWKKNEN